MSSPSVQTQVFDPSPFDLPIPTVDGLKADKLRVSFTGTIDLDRTDLDDLELLEKLKLGRDYPFTVEATCVSKPQAYSPSEDGPGTTLVQATMKVHTLRR
jgi:hypothetical protein